MTTNLWQKLSDMVAHPVSVLLMAWSAWAGGMHPMIASLYAWGWVTLLVEGTQLADVWVKKRLAGILSNKEVTVDYNALKFTRALCRDVEWLTTLRQSAADAMLWNGFCGVGLFAVVVAIVEATR